jgi:hypothetical protein
MYEVLIRSKANLDRALSDASAAKLPDAGVRWNAYSEAVRSKFNNIRTPLEAIHFAQDGLRHGGFESRDSSEKLLDLVQGQELHLQTMFPEFADKLDSFTESHLSLSETVAGWNGRLISRPLFAHAHFILRCLQQVARPRKVVEIGSGGTGWNGRLIRRSPFAPLHFILRWLQHGTRPRNVVEIGGGYGAPGRLWMTNAVHSPSIYCDVDLPESLFFAENYLGLHFGPESTLYLHRKADLEKIEAGTTKFLLCPPHAIDVLNEVDFDLALNTNSLGEMSAEYVDFYMRWLDQQRANLFYSCNYFAYDLTRMEENVNFMSPCLSDCWLPEFKAIVGEPPHLTAELIFRRQSKKAEAEGIDNHITRLLDEALTKDTLFDLVDLSRLTSNDDLLWKIISKIDQQLGYLPKEVVHLSDKLVEIRGGSLKEEHIRFRERVQTIVGSSARGKVSPHLSKTSGQEPATTVPVAKKLLIEQLRVTEDFFGAVEQISPQENGLIAYGWAADTQHGLPASQVCCFSGNTLVALGTPVYERRDIVAGFGEGTRIAGFRLLLPMVERSDLTFFGLAESGRVGRLKFDA